MACEILSQSAALYQRIFEAELAGQEQCKEDREAIAIAMGEQKQKPEACAIGVQTKNAVRRAETADHTRTAIVRNWQCMSCLSQWFQWQDT